MAKKEKDRQRNAWQLTINNPLEKELEINIEGVKSKVYDHESIKHLLLTKFSTLQYFIMSDEIGEEGTPHTHIYLYCNSRIRFSMVKKYFPCAHIEDAIAGVEENIAYIRKSGKWENTDKSETTVSGSIEEWGDKPIQKGSDQMMSELYNLINQGYTNAEIISYNNDYIKNINLLDRVRTTILIDKYKNERRLNLKVTYVYGATGMGKTRGILDEYGDANVFRVTDYKNPFDHYACQEVMVLDEFRSSLKISDLLNYADVYPIELPARYANAYACYEHLYIVSNWPLEAQYSDVQNTSPETWKALLRRIHEVKVYNDDGSINVYDSMDAYMCRDEQAHIEGFHNTADEIPF